MFSIKVHVYVHLFPTSLHCDDIIPLTLHNSLPLSLSLSPSLFPPFPSLSLSYHDEYVLAMVASPLLSSGCVSWSRTDVNTLVISTLTATKKHQKIFQLYRMYINEYVHMYSIGYTYRKAQGF